MDTVPRGRKTPQQARSREMVIRIVDAGARVIATSGYDAASTNRIAAEAGVSPGSLYQYFADKTSIALAVVERFLDQMNQRMAEEASAVWSLPFDIGLRRVLNAMFDALEETRPMVPVLFEVLPQLRRHDKAIALERRFGDLARSFFLLHRDQLRQPDLDTAVWLVANTMQTAGIRFVLEQPPIGRDRLVEGLAQMITSYVQ